MYSSLDSPFGSPAVDRQVVGVNLLILNINKVNIRLGYYLELTLKALEEDILSKLSYWNASLEPEAQGNRSHRCYLILLKFFYFVHYALFGVNFLFLRIFH